MDKLLVIVSGAFIAAVGIGFLAAHEMYPYLNSAYVSAGFCDIIMGTGMVIWGKKLDAKKSVEQLR